MSLEDLLYPPHDYSKKLEIVDAIEQCSQNINDIDSEEHAKELSSTSKDLSSYSSEMSSFVQDVLENDYHTACTIYFSNPEEYSFPFKDWQNAKGLTYHDCKEFLNRCPQSTLLFDTHSIIKYSKDDVLRDLFAHHLSNQYTTYYKENTISLLITLLFLQEKESYQFLSKINSDNGLISSQDIKEFLNTLITRVNDTTEQVNHQNKDKETIFKLNYLKPLAFLTHLTLIDEQYRAFALPILNQVNQEFIPSIFKYMTEKHDLSFYSYNHTHKNKHYARPSQIKSKLLSSLIDILPEDKNQYFFDLANCFISECENRIIKKDFYSNSNLNEISETIHNFKISIEKSILERSIINLSNCDLLNQDKKKVKI
jgi:hypothetical protein